MTPHLSAFPCLRRPLTLVATWLLLVSAAACGSPTEPTFDDADVRVMFIGNSLTFFNNLPDLVEAVAEVGGTDISTVTYARANYSLEEHWRDGIADRIRSLQPDLIVMQQGPSSLLQNQFHLRAWADSVARVAHEVGSTPALMMVWPSIDRFFAFDAVLESYSDAAEATGSEFAPAGEAWREVWADDADAELYGDDGFHPSPLGSLVAALTVAHALLDIDLTALPATLDPETPGLPTITMSAEQAVILPAAVMRAVAAQSGG